MEWGYLAKADCKKTMKRNREHSTIQSDFKTFVADSTAHTMGATKNASGAFYTGISIQIADALTGDVYLGLYEGGKLKKYRKYSAVGFKEIPKILSKDGRYLITIKDFADWTDVP